MLINIAKLLLFIFILFCVYVNFYILRKTFPNVKNNYKTENYFYLSNICLYLMQIELLTYLRSCVKKEDNIFNSSCVLSLAIAQAKAEIKVTNSQFFILKYL